MTDHTDQPRNADSAAAASPAGAEPGSRRRGSRAKQKGNKAQASRQAAPSAGRTAASKNEGRRTAERSSGSARNEGIPRWGNALLWLLACAIVIAAIGGNFYYMRYVVSDESVVERLLRVGAVIALILIGLAITLFTNRGRSLIAFGRESYIELRKVVWPTRQEAIQTTLIIFIAVCVVSLFLYLCDLAFLQMVKLITL